MAGQIFWQGGLSVLLVMFAVQEYKGHPQLKWVFILDPSGQVSDLNA